LTHIKVETDLPEDPIEAALKVMERFDKVFRSECSDSRGKIEADAIVRRLKNAPQLMLQTGLIPTVTFYLSKLDKKEKQDAYSIAIRVIQGVKNTLEDEEKRKFCSNTSGEGGGYPHALALILAYAAKQAGCKLDNIVELNSEFLKCIEEIQKRGATIERLVQAYVNELKKIASALYPSKG
jgi:CRISPR type III-B/RAMP module-associated protein Cmr5